MEESPCTWHGAEAGIEAPPAHAVVRLKVSRDRSVYTRQVASAERRQLGEELTRRSKVLKAKLREDDESGILVDIPAKLQRVWRSRGTDPVEAWLEMKLTDIFLNLGRTALTKEMIEMLPEPSE